LKYDKNIAYFALRPIYMYGNDSIVLLRMRKCFKVVAKIKTYFVVAVVLPLFVLFYPIPFPEPNGDLC
jgi:hypothetical protein